MIIILDGYSEHVAHAWKKRYVTYVRTYNTTKGEREKWNRENKNIECKIGEYHLLGLQLLFESLC